MVERKVMLSRITISLVLAAALVGAPMRVSARPCILSNASGEKACHPGCCANKACCATSSKNTAPVPQPFAKGDSGTQFNAIFATALVTSAPACQSIDLKISSVRATAFAHFPPQLAALCTFLI
jgi:hypothetical protein